VYPNEFQGVGTVVLVRCRDVSMQFMPHIQELRVNHMIHRLLKVAIRIKMHEGLLTKQWPWAKQNNQERQFPTSDHVLQNVISSHTQN
jgi:asparagine synthetase B (glutamine-hydrolysing)